MSDPVAAAWAGWGELEPDVLGHLINPTFMGGPRWPAMRQAFRVARRAGLTLVASDGLSDPFDEPGEGGQTNGFELEVYAISSEPVGRVAASWLFQLAWQMAQQCASNGGVADLIDELGLVSTELYDVPIPPELEGRFVNDAHRVGALLAQSVPGLPDSVQGAHSQIRLVNLQLLTLDELGFVVERGEQGREELAARLAAAGVAGVSSLARKSVV